MASDAIFVLGHRGMLGRAVTRYLRERDRRVLTTERRYTGVSAAELIAEVASSDCRAVINCVGTTPASASGFDALFMTNALLPQHLAAALGGGRTLVHASSDAVFDGRRGFYRVDEAPNAIDDYGLSKRLGERCLETGRAVILRTSIVGIDPGKGRGLLSWFLSDSTPVPGFVNHVWNGITVLTWASLALSAIDDTVMLDVGVHQPASAKPVTKHELLRAAADAFEHARPVVATHGETAVDRSLSPTIACAPITEQLRELARWERLT